MKDTVTLLLAGILLAGCGAPLRETGTSTDFTEPRQGTAVAQKVKVYGAVVRRLVNKDHTFGGSLSPFRHLYIVDGTVKGAGDPMEGNAEPRTPFPKGVKEGLRKELDDLPPVSFVTDPDPVRLGLDGMRGVKNDGVIITLGPLTGKTARVEVSNSLWCGGFCGQWLTYIVKLRGDHWEVTGKTGPIAIS